MQGGSGAEPSGPGQARGGQDTHWVPGLLASSGVTGERQRRVKTTTKPLNCVMLSGFVSAALAVSQGAFY